MDEFDVLRREATKLERHLEDRVARYQQLAQGLQAASATSSSLLDAVESGSASGSLVPTQEETTLRNEIQRTLSSLQDLISQQLGPAAERSGRQQHLLLVKRYREILYDLTGDFHKASATLQRKRDMAELLANSKQKASAENEKDAAMEHLLRERSHINNSLSASSAVIGQASEIHSDLKSQGSSLKQNVAGKLSLISTNIPSMNRLVEAIRKKRSRDDYILAGVIASCILFTLWYLFG